MQVKKLIRFTISFIFLYSNCVHHRSQIRQTLKKQIYEEAGIPVRQVTSHTLQTPDISPVLEAPSRATEQLNLTLESVKQELDTSSSIDSQSNSLLLLDQDQPVDDIISDTFKDEKIIFDAPSNLDLLTDDFSLNPLNETAEHVIDEVIQNDDLKMDLDNVINTE